MLDFENSTDMRALTGAELDHVAGGLSVSSVTVPDGIIPAGFSLNNVSGVNLSYDSATGYTTISLNILEYAETSGRMGYTAAQDSTFHAGVTAGSNQTTTTTTTSSSWTVTGSFSPNVSVSWGGLSVAFSGVGVTVTRAGSNVTTTVSRNPATPATAGTPAGGTAEKPKYGGKPSKK
jgi:hypothetical protein